MAEVSYQRSDFKAAQKHWVILNDVCAAGDEAVKSKNTAYLPMPNPRDQSEANADRYHQYLRRAVFYNATGRTLRGLVGMAFRRWPELILPDALDALNTDADGAGVSIYQQSQSVLASILKLGRHGLFVDYPETQGEVSKAQKQANHLRPRIISVDARNIINWRTSQSGGSVVLSLVVIKEDIEIASDDGFGMLEKTQYRALSLHGNRYRVRLFDKDNLDKPVKDYFPTDGKGNTWSEIPFTFVGATNNDSTVDEPPLLDLANLNLAHYRNSADYEDSVFFTGQAQMWLSGLSETWRDHLESKGIYAGSRTPLLLPEGGSCGYAQPQPNMLVKEAMDTKERQMVALGAKLIERGSAIKTATQVDSEDATSHSILSLAANNVSDAYSLALKWYAQYEGIESDDLSYAISQDYIDVKADPQMITALVTAWQQGAIPQSQLWFNLRKVGTIDAELADEDLKGEIESETPSLNLDDDA